MSTNPNEIMFSDLAQDAELVANSIAKDLSPQVQDFIKRHVAQGSHIEVRVAMTHEGFRFSLMLCNRWQASELWAAGAGCETTGGAG